VEFMKFLASDDPEARGLLQRFRQFKADCTHEGDCAVCRGHCLLVQLTNNQESPQPH